jgi:hypothetical protein
VCLEGSFKSGKIFIIIIIKDNNQMIIFLFFAFSLLAYTLIPLTHQHACRRSELHHRISHRSSPRTADSRCGSARRIS